ncbi:MAG: hypothetical protein PHS64_05255 [Candidatus Omnitrophica bacterium]|nr:hypothetical protein [Candidatus Omnitrophota bacterium]MDD5775329.1 hypothetical protein [Candidatus Omnitrophota bacterium]
MREKKLRVIFFVLPAISLLTAGLPFLLGYCQSTPASGSEITVSGRLYLEGSPDKGERLILHGVDQKAYLISGALAGQLLDIARQKKDLNRVELTGVLDPVKTIRQCETRNDLAYNDKGEQIINRTASCIRYYHFEPRTIVSCIDSNAVLPELIHDTQAETHARASPPVNDLKPAMIGEIYGTIRQVNLRSPVKTVEIRNSDHKSDLKSVTVVITAKTRIARVVKGKEPVLMLPENLKTGQPVVVMYDKNEIRTEALSIAVTK